MYMLKLKITFTRIKTELERFYRCANIFLQQIHTSIISNISTYTYGTMCMKYYEYIVIYYIIMLCPILEISKVIAKYARQLGYQFSWNQQNLIAGFIN